MRYREKALAEYQKHLSAMQPDLERESALAARLYARNIAPHLPIDSRAAIVDLGCGFGFFLRFLQDRGYHDVTGVDICETNVRICQDQGFAAEQGDNLGFLRQHPSRFDCITLYHVLEHYDKESGLEFLETIHASLKPGGRALIILPNMANPLTGSRSRYLDITHEIGYTEESLTQILQLAGYSRTAMHPMDHYCLPNPLINLPGKLAGWCLLKFWRVLFLLNGVRSTRIYTKHLLGVAVK